MSRPWTIVVGLVLAATLLAAWAGFEARRQRRETEDALRSQAEVLASTLGPSLAAAASAARELDEIVAWKLLDNARLLARLKFADALDPATFERLAEANGLDAAAVIDAGGRVVESVGDTLPAELLRQRDVLDVATGRADEAVLGWALEEERGHVAAVARRPGGGAVLVRTHASTAYAFARRLGVANLLGAIVGTGGVRFLSYRSDDHDVTVERSWDGGPAPPPRNAADPAIRSVRGVPTFEVDVPVAGPAPTSGRLRIGLDAGPLLRASNATARRTALVGLLLAAFGLAGVGFATVSRARDRERRESERRLAEVEERRRQSERLAAAGALAAGVAHEIRNPLNAIALASQRIERGAGASADSRRLAATIRGEVARLERIVEDFLELGRPATGPRVRADLAELVREVAMLLADEAASRRVEFRPHAPPGPVMVPMDRESVRRALVNLARNALQAAPEGSAIEVAVETAGGVARLRVLDRGPGLDPSILGRAFDPFVTTRAAGTGLGLALVRRVAEEHGGWARLVNRPDGGAEAILELRAEDDR